MKNKKGELSWHKTIGMLLFISLIAGSFGIFIASLQNNYANNDVTINQTKFEDFDQLTEIYQTVNQSNSELPSGAENSWFDILGNFVNLALTPFRTIAGVTVFFTKFINGLAGTDIINAKILNEIVAYILAIFTMGIVLFTLFKIFIKTEDN